jgi:hypothetical protein
VAPLSEFMAPLRLRNVVLELTRTIKAYEDAPTRHVRPICECFIHESSLYSRPTIASGEVSHPSRLVFGKSSLRPRATRNNKGCPMCHSRNSAETKLELGGSHFARQTWKLSLVAQPCFCKGGHSLSLIQQRIASLNSLTAAGFAPCALMHYYYVGVA